MEGKKDMEGCSCGCGCPCCGAGGMGMRHGGKHVLMTLGILAFVYGVTTWAMAAYAWPMYVGWTFGGALLIVISWLKMWKKHMMMKSMMKE